MFTYYLVSNFLLLTISTSIIFYHLRDAWKWDKEQLREKIKRGSKDISSELLYGEGLYMAVTLSVFSIIPIVGTILNIGMILYLIIEGPCILYRGQYYDFIKKQKEEKNRVKNENKKKRYLLRTLRKYPDLCEQILADPSHTYYKQVSQLQKEGKASLCLKDKTLTLDGKVYRIEQVDIY